MRPTVYIAERPADESPTVSEARDFIREGRLSRPRALPPHLAALRDRLRPARSLGGVLLFEDPRVDGCLGGGLPLGQLHEIGAAGLDAETGALPTAFIAALLARIAPARPVFWIAPVSDLHPPGLLPYGLDPNRLVLVRPAKDVDTLAAMEVALREGVAGAVVGEVGQFDRTASRRSAACLPAQRHHRLCAAPLAVWPQERGSRGQRGGDTLASYAGAEREGRQGAGPAALACGADACPWRASWGMDHGGFG